MPKHLAGLLIALTLIVADQVTKWAVMERVLRPATGDEAPAQGFGEWLITSSEPLAFVRIEVTSFFNWVMVWNRGISFGLFQNDSAYGPYAMMAVALVIAFFFTVWLFRTDRWIIATSIGLVIGGAIGNVIDRARFGAVADFLDFHVMGYHWPAFNVADTAITVGIALLVIDGLFFEPRKDREQT